MKYDSATLGAMRGCRSMRIIDRAMELKNKPLLCVVPDGGVDAFHSILSEPETARLTLTDTQKILDKPMKYLAFLLGLSLTPERPVD